MKVTRIKAPKFKVGRNVLNEYEVRQLQLEVAQGVREGDIKIKDLANGRISVLGSDAMFNPLIENLGIGNRITLNLLKERRSGKK